MAPKHVENEGRSPSPSQPRAPAYRLHRRSGLGVVTLGGKDHYLGRHGSQESRAAYLELVSRWLANGRKPVEDAPAVGLSLNEALLRYVEYAETYYTREGKPDERTLWHVRRAVRAVREMFGSQPAASFTAKRLALVRDHLIEAGYCRKTLNRYTTLIKKIFRWAVGEELVPPSTWQSLSALEGLKRGRCEAPEPEPVRPVPDAYVDAVRPHVARQVWGLIELQRLCGCRPGEAVAIRGCDIDTTGETWLWRPMEHKNSWRGQARIVAIGPRAQQVIHEFWKPDVQAFLFSPADADAEIRTARTAARKTPLSCGNKIGTNRKRHPDRKPHDRYSVGSYARAIARACDSAGIPKWSPNRLRHSFATAVRKQFGVDAAAVSLGHAGLDTVEIYAEKNAELAVKVARAIG